MPLNLSFGNVIEPEPVPEGIHDFRVADVEVRQSKNNPNNQNLNFKYEVLDPELSHCYPVWETISLSPNARWKLKIVLEALTGESWDQDDMELDPRDLLGCEFRATIFHETYKDRINARIEKYFRD